MCMQLMDGLCKELICAVTGLSEWLLLTNPYGNENSESSYFKRKIENRFGIFVVEKRQVVGLS